MAKRKIGLDAGHGENTYNETGSKGVPGLEEHHFNATVVKYAKEHLERNNFEVVLTQPLFGKDVSLRARTDLANRLGLDLLMSFHADANGNKAARGHWGFYWHTSPEGKRLAQFWSEELVKLTGTRHRGNQACNPNVSWPNFHMVRESHMIAVLMEHAFMTNPEDLKLLQSDLFRRQCGEAAAKAVCRYYGVAYIPEVIVKPAEVKKELEVDEKLNLTPGQKNEMANVYRLAKELELFSSDTHADKVLKGELTVSEGIYLITALVGRHLKEEANNG